MQISLLSLPVKVDNHSGLKARATSFAIVSGAVRHRDAGMMHLA